MATYTTVGIVNHALLLCGASPITALTDDTVNARTVNAVFTNARKSFLTECRWTFATTRSTLSTNSTTGLFPWTFDEEGYVYAKPGSPTFVCLRIWDMSEPTAIWREEGEYIIADCDGLGARWTWDHDELGLWSPKAIEAFMDKLCCDISYMIINSTTKAQAFLEKYEKVSLPKATAENSQTGFQQEVIDDNWTNAHDFRNPARSYS